MMTLSMAHAGQNVRVVSLDCGAALNKRLCDLGIYDNTVVRVVRNDRGPLVVEAKDSRLAIGRGEADKIMVQAVGR